MRALNTQEALDAGYTGSLKGYVYANYEDLIRIFGEPAFIGGPENKINFEWAINYKGDIFSLYDWKTSIEWSKSQPDYKWHVGGLVDASEFILAVKVRIELLKAESDVKTYSAAMRSPSATEDERAVYSSERNKAIKYRDSVQAQADRLLTF